MCTPLFCGQQWGRWGGTLSIMVSMTDGSDVTVLKGAACYVYVSFSFLPADGLLRLHRIHRL